LFFVFALYERKNEEQGNRNYLAAAGKTASEQAAA
jgi:hypothetical protein